jgi:hypothetical protein
VIDVRDFFQTANPARTLDPKEPNDRKLYIDFSAVRGEQIIGEIKDLISAKGNGRKEIGADDDDRSCLLNFLASGGVEVYQPDFAATRVRHREAPSLRYLGPQTR